MLPWFLSLLLSSSPDAVDAHVHVSASEIDRAVRHFDASGIDWALNLSGGWTGRRLETQLTAAHRSGRFVVAVNLPWRFAAHPRFVEVSVEILQKATRRGARALKIEKALGLSAIGPDGRRLPVDSPLLDPIWRAAGRLGLPVVIHTGDPKAFWEPITPSNERYEELRVHPEWSNRAPGLPSFDALLKELDRVVDRHPGTLFVSVHFGNHAEDPASVAKQLDERPNLFVDLAARIVELGRIPNVRQYLERHSDRILFGTDLGLWPRGGVMLGSTGKEPDTDEGVLPYYQAHWRWLETKDTLPSPVPIQGRWPIHGVALSAKDLRRIYRGNAEMLFGPPPWASRAARSYPPYFRLSLRN